MAHDNFRLRCHWRRARLGAALARRFAKGYAVAINARKADSSARWRRRFEARVATCLKRRRYWRSAQTAAMFGDDSRAHRLPRDPPLHAGSGAFGSVSTSRSRSTSRMARQRARSIRVRKKSRRT